MSKVITANANKTNSGSQSFVFFSDSSAVAGTNPPLALADSSSSLAL